MNTKVMDEFYRKLPKVELHAHLNGSLSQATILELKRYYADMGVVDNTNIFFDEFQIGAGDSKHLSDCFHNFSIAHALTTYPHSLELATYYTLKEFEHDGCCYIELRSTPRETLHMNRSQYIDAILQGMHKASKEFTIIARLIISIDRRSEEAVANEIADLAIEYKTLYPHVVCGIELSGNPAFGRFKDFVPALEKARKAGLKVTIHCAESCNNKEVLEIIKFKPDRIGHGTTIHPRLGGTQENWALFVQTKIPVEICMTSNLKTKSILDYEAHHFKEFFDAGVPIIICTDDKGVFATSLSQEYMICAETFELTQGTVAKLALNACNFIFDTDSLPVVQSKVVKFITDNKL